MARIIDISQPIYPGMLVYPGDPAFSTKSVLSFQNGDACEVSELTIGSHCGTHVDAPSHMLLNGATLDQLSLAPFLGECRVISICQAIVSESNFVGANLQVGERLLLKTDFRGASARQCSSNPVVLDRSAAAYLAAKQIALIGIDSPSVEDMDCEQGEVHRILLDAGVSILEGIELSDVEDGTYRLSALPLSIVGGNGSPCRAVLFCE